MNKKFISFILLIVFFCTIILTSCSNNNSTAQTSPVSQLAVTDQSTSADTNADKDVSTVISQMDIYDKDDYYSDWKSEALNYIELRDNTASIKGSGAVVNDSKVTITTSGVYVISGKLENGQIIVDVSDKETVRLILNGVEINCADNAPIYLKNAEKTIITLQDGTENLITDGEKYVLLDSSSDEPNAAIFSKDDLTINGAGKLIVQGNYNNGITSKDDLKITGGNIQIYAVDDGLMGRDMVAIKAGNISIEASGDGIKTTNDTDTSKGFIAFEGGTYDIKAGSDGIQAETSVFVSDGSFTILSGGGSANSSNKISNNMKKPWGEGERNPDINANETTKTESTSTKGIKASTQIVIGGGTFKIDSADDALHSNNSISITDGDIIIASGDDGIHADSNITTEGGKIEITKSYEGIESSVVTITDSEIYVVANDDGINIAGGNDGSSINGRPGQNNFKVSENNKLIINSGYIVVDADGDGLDANGSIYMTDGTVILNGPTSNNNGAIDYDGVFEISGGLLVAAGSAGMAQAPSQQSTQSSIILYYPNIQQANNLVNLTDNNGNTVVTFAPKKQYQSLLISSPQIKKGLEYTLFSGGNSTGDVKDGLYSAGAYQEGTEVVNFTITNIVTWLSETGVTAEGGFNPGGGNHSDFKGRPNTSGSEPSRLDKFKQSEMGVEYEIN